MAYLISFIVFLILLYSSITGGKIPTKTENRTSTTAAATTSSEKTVGIIRIKPVSGNGTSTNRSSPSTQTNVNGKYIVYFTNEQRTKKKVRILKTSIKLQLIAEGRIKDMVENNYFDHSSPTGKDVTGLANIYQYFYRFLGENLAMGDFSSSEELVNDWMRSPGHEANILNPEYTEIGAAATYTVIMGRKQWIAVQIFGRPF